jgi:hypothetical protein
MTAVLDELAELKQRRVAQYCDAIEDVLAGKEIPLDELESICLKAGKEPRDFASTVSYRQRRIKDRERVAALPGIREQLEGVNAQITAADEAFEATRREHITKVYNLDALRTSLQRDLAELVGLEQRLIQGGGIDGSHARIQETNKELDALRYQRSDAERNLTTQQARLRSASRGQVEKLWLNRDARSAPLPAVADGDEFATYKLAVVRAQQAIDAIDNQINGYLEEQNQIRRQQFEW